MRPRTKWGKKQKRRAINRECVRQRNAKRVDSAKFGNEAHFMSFAAIIATRNGTEGSNFHIRNTMTAIVEVSGNRLVCVVACDRATVLAKPSPQTSSSFSNVKHATSTA